MTTNEDGNQLAGIGATLEALLRDFERLEEGQRSISKLLRGNGDGQGLVVQIAQMMEREKARDRARAERERARDRRDRWFLGWVGAIATVVPTVIILISNYIGG